MPTEEKYCIVRTTSAGVFAGNLVKRDGKEGRVENARRLWYWAGAASLSQLANEGVKRPRQCKFPAVVPYVEMTEIMELLRDLQAGLQHAIRADGFNIGLNIGRCAGAGLPDHIHIHVVPRWSGDTNFMPILGGVHVIPDFLETIHEKISHAGRELGLPKFSAPGKS
ncbi:hypothetical protein LCGC14_3031580 [marine sediment metagenome]|uniref:HIT domain-containing protein n=1 Tax=marine sediment metagenome TaxID=412755 RepID=A0A0F8Z037_9ZZZZ